MYIPEQTTPEASFGEQSCWAHAEWGHADSTVSVPLHKTSSSQMGVGAEVSGVVMRVTTSLVAFPKPGGRRGRGEREGAERERERRERGMIHSLVQTLSH